MANFISSLTGQQLNDALTQVNQRVPEGWAVGERDGIPVSSSSPYYHNNAKYYAETAGQTVQQAAQQVVEDATAQAERAEDAANRAEAAVPAGTAGAVFFDRVQTLTEGQKEQARENIGTDKPSELSSASGDIVSFADGSATLVKDLKASLDIVQPVSYGKPWPAGGGKNICPYENGTATSNGVTFTPQADGSIKISGTATDTATYYFYSNNNILNLPAGESFRMIVTTNGGTGASGLTIAAQSSSGTLANGTDITVTIPSADTNSAARLRIQRYTVIDLIAYPLIMLASQTNTDWVPYANICPIIPHSAVEVSRIGKNLTVALSAGQTISQGITFNHTGNAITATGTSTNDNAEAQINIVPTLLKANTTYVMSFGTRGVIKNIRIDSVAYTPSSSGAFTLTFTEDKLLTNFVIRLYSPTGTVINSSWNWQLELGSTATAYEPYAGQRYLVNIGINQWDEEWELGTYDDNTGEPASATTTIRNKNIISVIGGTDYYFKTPQNGVAFWYDASRTFISSNAITNGSITAPANAHYMNFRMASGYGTTYNNNISINYPSRFTSYYPYTGHTVYGGELDVTTGVLTVRYGMVDLGSLTWTYRGGVSNIPVGVFSVQSFAGYKLSSNVKAVCSNYPYVGTVVAVTDNKADKSIYLYYSAGSTATSLYIRDTGYTDAAAFKAAVSGVQFVYELASPFTIQLTPTEVQTLTGTNNLWADSGAVNVSYWTEGLIEADNLNAVLDSKKVVYASPHTYPKEDALQARLNIGAGSNKNLLDNPWFTVNQRGITTLSTSAAQYTLDRWLASGTGSTITVNTDKSVTIAKTAGTLVFTQRTELPKDYTKVYTLSVLLSNGEIFSKTGVFNAGTQGETAYRPTGMMSFYLGLWTQGGYLAPAIYLNANQTGNLTIKAVKLELGSVSTLANDAPPCYAEELAKCQRYFYRLPFVSYTAFASGVGVSDSQIRFSIPTPVPMRATPTLSFTGAGVVTYKDGSSMPQLGLDIHRMFGNFVSMTLTVSSATTYNDYVIGWGYQSSTIDLSADL